MRTYAEKKELNNGNCSTPVGTNLVLGPHHNSTTLAPKSQENKLEKELSEKFTPKKKMSERLVMSYIRLSEDDPEFFRRAELVANCGTYLEFAKYSDESFKLHRANFCRDRLCPMCSWRRSYKIFGQVSEIMDLISSDYAFIFVTLTVRSCDGEDLSKLIDRMNNAWRKFIKYKRIKPICKGFFKALEITYNAKTDCYHPHFHVIFAVPKGYFVGRDYIQHDEWLDMWRKAMQDPRILIVDVRRVRDKNSTAAGAKFSKKLSSAVAEVAKYAVKSADYLFISERLTDFCVYTFSEVLKNRRLCALGGCFLEAHKKLKHDDLESGDLIHLDSEIRSDVALQIFRYGWSCGAYKLVEVVDKSLDLDNILAECDDDD